MYFGSKAFNCLFLAFVQFLELLFSLLFNFLISKEYQKQILNLKNLNYCFEGKSSQTTPDVSNESQKSKIPVIQSGFKEFETFSI